MSSLILPSKRFYQPAQPASVDRQNTFGRSLLIGGYPTGNSWWEAAQEKIVGITTGSIAGASQGFAHDLTNTAQAFTLESKNTVTTNRITVWAIVNTDEQARADFVSVWTGGTANSQFNLLQGVAGSGRSSFFISNGSTNASAAAGAGFVLAQNDTSIVVGTYDGSTVKVFLDGVLAGQASSSITLNTTSLTSYRIGNNGNGDGGYDGRIIGFGVHNESFSDNFVRELSYNPWQIFRPHTRRVFFDLGAGGGTHTTTGSLSADAATIAGTAAHSAIHATTGALSAADATVSGTAAHSALHTTTGALAAQDAIIVGVANKVVSHATSGALSSDAATIIGTAEHAAPGVHDTTGALAADAALVAGSALHIAVHAAEGALAAGTATISGTSVHTSVGGGTGATVEEIWAYEIEPGVTAKMALQRLLAVMGGKVSGAGTGTEVFRDINDTRDALISTNDSNGNRTGLTWNDGP